VRLAVVVAEPAERQLRTIDAWWRANRPAATHLFEQEFAAAIETLSTHPWVGARVRRGRVKELRRVLLRSARYHVYYLATDEAVFVLAIWSAVGGGGPPISVLAPPT
jgi:plasmid stabilization system protein ParE